MDDTPIKKPDSDFKLEQENLKNRLESNLGGTASVKESLDARFQQAFHLKLMPETEFTYQCIRHLEKFIPEIIDHARAYQMLQQPGLTLILSQPYVRVEGVMADYPDVVGPLGVQSVNLSEWTFHYPGRTSAIGFIVSRKALQAMKAAIQADQETMRGNQVFWDF